MKEARKNFYPQIRGAFACLKCKAQNTDTLSSPRNHCHSCLYSLHVDDMLPGDRESQCHGLMEPIDIDHSGKKGYILIHECIKCHKKQRNKIASDDNQETLMEYMQRKVYKTLKKD